MNNLNIGCNVCENGFLTTACIVSSTECRCAGQVKAKNSIHLNGCKGCVRSRYVFYTVLEAYVWGVHKFEWISYLELQKSGENNIESLFVEEDG